MRILVVGGSGFIGRRLVELAIRAGHWVAITSRRSDAKAPPGAEVVVWNTQSALELPPVDAVVSLAGEGIFERRLNAKQKEVVRNSRIETTKRIVAAIQCTPSPPAVLVSASAIGWYGDRQDEELDETSSPGVGFLAELSRDWEAAASALEGGFTRVVRVRVGVVMGDGGALSMMLLPFKLGVGGRVASGQQWVSWIHLNDIARLFLHCVENKSVDGVINATAPKPVRNIELTKTLGRVLRRPTIFPVPAFALRLLYGEAAEVVIGGQRVMPRRALAMGFEFEYTELESALRQVLDRPATR